MEYAYISNGESTTEVEGIDHELVEVSAGAAANYSYEDAEARLKDLSRSGGAQKTADRISKSAPRVRVYPAASTGEIPEKNQPIYQSRAMQFLLHRAELVAKLPVPVIVAGAPGTGKSRLVEYVHRNSQRGAAGAPLIELNCRALVGAGGGESAGDDIWRRLLRKKLYSARQGTLWVHHLEDLEPALRFKLLAFLCEVCGSESAAAAQARLVLTLPADDRFEVECRNQLGAVMLVMPTLAERREDILPLARAFLKEYSNEYKLERALNARAVEYVKTYAWPGNVRQLQSTLLNALIQAPGQNIRYEDLAAFTGEARSEYEGGPVPTFQEQVDNFERGLLQSVLEQCHGNQSQVSRMLQMNRGTLIRKIKQYELDGCGRPACFQGAAQ